MKAGRKMRARRDERRAQFDQMRIGSKGAFTRPGSLKKKGKSAGSNRANKGRAL